MFSLYIQACINLAETTLQTKSYGCGIGSKRNFLFSHFRKICLRKYTEILAKMFATINKCLDFLTFITQKAKLF
jgi:hypothetical protein